MSLIAPCRSFTTVIGSYQPPALTLFHDEHLEYTVERVLDHRDKVYKHKLRSLAKNILYIGKVSVLSIILGSQNPFLLTALTLFLNIGCKGQGSQLAQLTRLALPLEKQPVNSGNGRMHNGDLLTFHCFAFLVHIEVIEGHLQVQILAFCHTNRCLERRHSN